MTDDVFVTDVPREIHDALGGRWPTHQQWAAISAPLEPAVLIAGAGSGKTAVMAARMVWLIVGGHAKANEILGLTFTNKAAGELLQRVRRAVGALGLGEGEEPMIATYHAFAASLIADYGLRAGLEPGAALLSEAQVWQLCAELYAGRRYDAMEVRNLWHVPYVRDLADECANHWVDPDQVIAYDRDFLERIRNSADKISGKVSAACRKRIELAEVVREYQHTKRARNVLDYGDQIRLACELASDPAVAADFLARYRFTLLDEYQDTNVAQAKMLRALMPDGYPLMAVGDPDQNIYAWRGASLHNLLAFSEQFPRAGGELAHVLRLEVNFRSGRRILELANELIKGIKEEHRPPDKVLRHFDPLGEGSVAAFVETDQMSEAERIAGECVRLHGTGIPWREMAILCRKKRLFDGLVEVLREREIPVEVIGLGGLLKVPEVVDLVALLRVLDDPMRNVSLARLLRGPRWRIGHRDLALVARHAAERNRELAGMIPGQVESPGDVAFSLAEALAWVDGIAGVSDEARERIRRFDADLAALRAQTHLPLVELVERAVRVLGLAHEIDASPSRAAPAARRNLANFLDRVASFSPLDGEPTLGALIEWLDAVEESDEEIEAAQPTEEDSVKLMTIHQAKGLEFDVVFVPGLAAAAAGPARIFPDTGRQPNPATNPKYLPFELRGDRDVLPEFQGNLTAFTDDLRARALEEERRLLYVAVTRTRQRLIASSAHWYLPSGMGEALRTPMGPSLFYTEIAGFPETEVIVAVPQPSENPLIDRRAARASGWPPPARRAAGQPFPEGLAAAVRAARAGTPPDPTLFPLEPPPPAPPRRALPVTSLVTYERCPRQFFWSHVRPLPRRPNPSARVGTLIHSWLEERGKRQIPLVDPEPYEDHSVDGEWVAGLKAAFRATRFAGTKAALVEQPFALVVGDFVIRGQIDAIFERDDGGWEIVDWKTGRSPADPAGPERWQLDLYALAAQEIWGRAPEDLTLTFLYLGDGTERQVPVRTAAEIRASLGEALAAIAAGAFDPTPSDACRTCDFLLDCEAGRAHVGPPA